MDLLSIRSLAALLLAFVLAVAAPLAARANPQLLVDMNSGAVLYEQDAGQPWHPASLTKLMTAFVTFTAIAEGRVTLDTPVIVSRHAWNMAPSKSGLKVGSALSMRDALYVMLVKSERVKRV
jgi:D-alanyl-D-alanine carboxypeptidase